MSGSGTVPKEGEKSKQVIRDKKQIQDNQQIKLILEELRKITEQLKFLTGDE